MMRTAFYIWKTVKTHVNLCAGCQDRSVFPQIKVSLGAQQKMNAKEFPDDIVQFFSCLADFPPLSFVKNLEHWFHFPENACLPPPTLVPWQERELTQTQNLKQTSCFVLLLPLSTFSTCSHVPLVKLKSLGRGKLGLQYFQLLFYSPFLCVQFISES